MQHIELLQNFNLVTCFCVSVTPDPGAEAGAEVILEGAAGVDPGANHVPDHAANLGQGQAATANLGPGQSLMISKDKYKLS